MSFMGELSILNFKAELSFLPRFLFLPCAAAAVKLELN